MRYHNRGLQSIISINHKLWLALKIFGDVSGVEDVHFVDHADRGCDDGIGAQGSSSLAETQAQVEDGLGADDV